MAEFEPLTFIDISRHHRGGKPDRASLQVDKKTGRLRVLGGLDHTTEFEPVDLDAARAMMKWLAGWMRSRLGVPAEVAERLEYLRGEIRAERISYEELAELQDLAKYIDPADVELAEPAGLPEFPDNPA